MRIDKGVCVAFAVVIFSDWSCIKVTIANGTSALNIVNAVNLSSAIITDFTPPSGKGSPGAPLQYYSTANQIGYESSYESGSYVGEVTLNIFQNDDTTTSIWQGQFKLATNSIHTLFLAGDTTSVDTLFTVDNIPYYPNGDSVAGLRFVNLVQNGPSMAVDIQGNPAGQSEFNNLGYKQISPFKAYVANSSIPGSYNFEIRNQGSDSLLATFTWNYTIYKSQTVIIAGTLANPNYPIAAFIMNNF